MQRPTIRLEDHNGVFLRCITAREAELIASKGDGDRVASRTVSRKKRKGKHANAAPMTYRLKPPVPIKRTMDEASPASITPADILANVGIKRGEGDVSRSHRIMVRRKIRAFAPQRGGMTHTYVELEVSAAVYDEVAKKLRDAKYDHCFQKDGAIDMHGLALVKPKAKAKK